MNSPTKLSNLVAKPAAALGRPAENQANAELIASGQAEAEAVQAKLGTPAGGLTEADAEARLKEHGPNVIAGDKATSTLARLWDNIKNPLVILLAALAVISFLTGDPAATIIITIMIVLGVVLRYVQETQADNAAAKLQEMVSTTATVLREGKRQEVPLKEIVPGDLVYLSAGDMVPADMRVLSAKDLFISQAALTGESMPVEKRPEAIKGAAANPLEMGNLCFMGSNVESGTGACVVVLTGGKTYFGGLASSIAGQRQLTSFDKGINSFTWLMIRFMAIMVPLVFVLNGLSKHDWVEAFLFAVAVAVGLTPEMLPMIVSVNLSQGAIAMSKKKVIVRRLNAIQNFGAMDVLCTDKTGTITQGRIVLELHLDVRGDDSDRVLEYAYLNSYYQTGLKNLMDEAVLEHVELAEELKVQTQWNKIDEIPFDFVRKRMSVVIEDQEGKNVIICKGAVEEIMGLCSKVEVASGEQLPVLPEYDAKRRQLVQRLNEQGFRVVAVAYKNIPEGPDEPVYAVADECDMTLLGYLAFLDPPKESTEEALARLARKNVKVKILTGDNEVVTRTICEKVGLAVKHIVLGPEIEMMSEAQLAEAAEGTTVFAKLSPAHKERIIRALQSKDHVVGFMGDGINDAPALKAADVGISVDDAVDIAKESSAIILLENSLLVLEDGVHEGRRVFGNIMKYIKMAASSNFGNMFSVVGASIFLPFLPMLPIQVLINNLLYDFSQTAIPTDQVDEEWLTVPRKWTIGALRRFILFIGPCSSVFDYLTYGVMLFVFNAWNNPALFHTGWFVESLFTQTLIIHVIRTNKIPFLQSRASWQLTLASIAVVAAGAWLTVSPFAGYLGFVPLPATYWPILLVMLVAYVVLTQVVKTWFYRKYGD